MASSTLYKNKPWFNTGERKTVCRSITLLVKHGIIYAQTYISGNPYLFLFYLYCILQKVCTYIFTVITHG